MGPTEMGPPETGPPDLAAAAPLPPDAVLLHLGFHKTGTTAVQSTFAASRPALAEHGVLYPGRRRSHHPAAMAMTDRTWGVGREGGQEPDPRAWNRLARAARGHAGRVLISSENFALTPDEAAARMVADLGRDRVHVVFTMRPVAQLLGSSWQQYLKSGWTISYADWLDRILAELEPDSRRSGFWLRNDYPTIVGRWASLVGADRVHLVCLDPDDRGFLLRTFAELLDLPPGVVDPQFAQSNRSMTAAEAELLRALNAASADWDWPTYQHTIRRGAADAIVEDRQPDPDEAMLATPQEALDRVAAHGRAMAEQVSELGVVVHGDLSVLGEPVVGSADGPQLPPRDVPIEVAVAGILGAIRGAQKLAGEQVQAAVDEVMAAAQAAPGTRPRDEAGPRSDPDPQPVSPARIPEGIVGGARRRLAARRTRRLRPDDQGRP